MVPDTICNCTSKHLPLVIETIWKQWSVHYIHDGILTVKDLANKIECQLQECSLLIYTLFNRDEELIGFYFIEEEDNCGIMSVAKLTPWLSNLYIMEKHRGKGHMHTLVKHAVSQHKHPLYLWTNRQTLVAQYRKHGFEEITVQNEITVMHCYKSDNY